MRIIVGLFLFSAALAAYAESAYVTERLTVPMRAAVVEGSAVTKNIDGGAALEVLERADKYARVRDAQGVEGWVETRFLVNTAPARPQLERAQAEVAKLNKELIDAQGRIKKLETALVQQSARDAESPKVAEETTAQEQPAEPSVADGAPVDEFDFSWGWLVLAFAMLWIGFGAGVVWVRERHRKKLGGMYLRI